MKNHTEEDTKGRRLLLAVVVIFLALGIQSAEGQLVWATGKQSMQAATPEGQYIDFAYEAQGKSMHCGIRAAKLTFEFRLDDEGKQFLFVHELEPVGNKVEYAYAKEGSKDPVLGKTTFADLDYSTGCIMLTIAELPLSPPNSRYKATLVQLFKGRLTAIQSKPAQPTNQNVAKLPEAQKGDEKPADASNSKEANTKEAAQDYRAITREDKLTCGARVESMEFSFGGPPSGELMGFECLDKDGKTVQIPLASKKMVDGKIQTKDFGVVLLKNSTGTGGTYYMTENQIKKLKAFLGL